MNRIASIVLGLVIALMLISSSIFVVDQKSHAIVFAFGKVRAEIKEPGLHFKWPRPFENVVLLEKRIMTLDTADTDKFITAEKSTILIDSFIKWKIVNARTYFVSFGGDENRASNRMSQIIRTALNEEIAKRKLIDVISAERGKVMEAIRNKVANEAKDIGVQIVDVRLKRVDYVEAINNSVYETMKAERISAANLRRSTGKAESEQIRARAEKDAAIILAEAYNKAQAEKGAGDAEASAIYAQAFGRNPEFYKFYRSLEAYRSTFKSHSDVMVLDPNSEFFKYFRSPGGAGAAAPAKK